MVFGEFPKCHKKLFLAFLGNFSKVYRPFVQDCLWILRLRNFLDQFPDISVGNFAVNSSLSWARDISMFLKIIFRQWKLACSTIGSIFEGGRFLPMKLTKIWVFWLSLVLWWSKFSETSPINSFWATFEENFHFRGNPFSISFKKFRQSWTKGCRLFKNPWNIYK